MRVAMTYLSLLLSAAVFPIETRGQAGSDGTQAPNAVELDKVIPPDPEIQELLRGLAEGAYRTPADAEAVTAQLRAKAGPDNVHLVSQLLYFRILDGEKAVQMYEQMAHLGITRSKLGLTPEESSAVLILYLESGNPELEHEIRQVLRSNERQRPPVGCPPDFSVYRAWLERDVREGREPTPALVRYIFDRHAGMALLTVMRALHVGPEGRPIVWAEHVISEVLWKQEQGFLEKDQTEPAAVEQVDNMARHEKWWARLYAAEIMRQQPEFRDPKLIEKLGKDDHPLVQQSVEALKQQESQRNRAKPPDIEVKPAQPE